MSTISNKWMLVLLCIVLFAPFQRTVVMRGAITSIFKEGSLSMARPSLREIWHIASFDRTIREKVAIELLTSWPIPDYRDGQLGYWFFYYASFGPPPAKEFKLFPPGWVVWIAASDGTISGPKRVIPQEVGLFAQEGESFATHNWPESWTMEMADQKREKLLKSYDNVVSIWEGKKGDYSAAALPEVADFRKRFAELTEPPLLVCYRTLGRSFFEWIGL